MAIGPTFSARHPKLPLKEVCSEDVSLTMAVVPKREKKKFNIAQTFLPSAVSTDVGSHRPPPPPKKPPPRDISTLVAALGIGFIVKYRSLISAFAALEGKGWTISHSLL